MSSSASDSESDICGIKSTVRLYLLIAYSDSCPTTAILSAPNDRMSE